MKETPPLQWPPPGFLSGPCIRGPGSPRVRTWLPSPHRSPRCCPAGFPQCRELGLGPLWIWPWEGLLCAPGACTLRAAPLLRGGLGEALLGFCLRQLSTTCFMPRPPCSAIFTERTSSISAMREIHRGKAHVGTQLITLGAEVHLNWTWRW